MEHSAQTIHEYVTYKQKNPTIQETMIKRITPFSILAILIAILCVYALFKDDEMGYSLLFVMYAIPFALFIWLIDFGLKKWLKTRKKIFVLEFSLIMVAFIAYKYTQRAKTLNINSDFDKEYISIIYDIPKQKSLGINAFTWSKIIDIPDSGILLTASDFNSNLPTTKIKMESGIYLNSDKTEKSFHEIMGSEFESNGKIYKYRTWKIQQEEYCCSWSSSETDSLDIEYKKLFDRKASR